MLREPPLAIAHRGSRLLWPENTMTSFEGAVALGYRWLETDIHVSADGVLVCLHDDTVDRTTDGSGRASALTYADLKRLDAGFRHDPETGHPFRGHGVWIPRFEEVVTAWPGVRVVVDLKEDGTEPVLADAVRRLDLWDRLVVGSFSDARLARFRRLTGGRVATSTGPVSTLREWMRAWLPVVSPPRQAAALQVPERYGPLRVVSPTTIERAHRDGLQVHVWTVNDPDDMLRLLGWGVDALITDRPDLLKKVLVDAGQWPG